MSYKLEADEGVREGIVRCATEQLDRAVGTLSDSLADDPVGAVHTARKAVKKERSLLRLVRGTIPAKRRRRENTALRDATRELSDARDAEVMIQTLDRLSARFTGQLPESTFEGARRLLIPERDARRAQLTDSALAIQSVQELDAVRRRVDGWPLRRDGWSAIGPGLGRSYQRGRQAMEAARHRRSLGKLHDWRKRVKDLWYQERLLAPAGGPTVRGQAKDLKRLSDLLGDDHDLGVLRGRLTVGHPDAAVDIEALLALIDHRRAELQTEAFRLGKRVYGERPRAFVQRMRRSWEAGRAVAAVPRELHPAELADATRASSTAG